MANRRTFVISLRPHERIVSIECQGRSAQLASPPHSIPGLEDSPAPKKIGEISAKKSKHATARQRDIKEQADPSVESGTSGSQARKADECGAQHKRPYDDFVKVECESVGYSAADGPLSYGNANGFSYNKRTMESAMLPFLALRPSEESNLRAVNRLNSSTPAASTNILRHNLSLIFESPLPVAKLPSPVPTNRRAAAANSPYKA